VPRINTFPANIQRADPPQLSTNVARLIADTATIVAHTTASIVRASIGVAKTGEAKKVVKPPMAINVFMKQFLSS
jgi:hypothetical protein